MVYLLESCFTMAAYPPIHGLPKQDPSVYIVIMILILIFSLLSFMDFQYTVDGIVLFKKLSDFMNKKAS